MASPTAAFAAATAIVNREKICPVKFGNKPNLLNATKFKLAALSINSIQTNTITVFRFVKAPNKPMQNKLIASVQYAEAGTILIGLLLFLILHRKNHCDKKCYTNNNSG